MAMSEELEPLSIENQLAIAESWLDDYREDIEYLKESLQECLDVIYGQFDPSVLDEGKATDEGVPGVVARAKWRLK